MDSLSEILDSIVETITGSDGGSVVGGEPSNGGGSGTSGTTESSEGMVPIRDVAEDTSGRVGYNLKNIKDEMDKIKNNFNILGTTIETEWEIFINELKANWVGEDELSYEDKLAKKINELHAQAKLTAKYGIEQLKIRGEEWAQWQRNNVLDGAEIFQTASTTIEFDPSELKEVKVFAKIETIGTDVDRGLVQANSATNIQTAMITFRDRIKQDVSALLDVESVKNAFFGAQQSLAISKMIRLCHSAMSDTMVAFQDMYDHVLTMTKEKYSAAEEGRVIDTTAVSEDFRSRIDSSRWNQGQQ